MGFTYKASSGLVIVATVSSTEQPACYVSLGITGNLLLPICPGHCTYIIYISGKVYSCLCYNHYIIAI